jgi:hypothetical protein
MEKVCFGLMRLASSQSHFGGSEFSELTDGGLAFVE